MELLLEKKRILMCEFVTIFVFMSFETAHAHKFTEFTLSAENARYSDILVQHLNIEVIQCALLCGGVDDCTSVNHNSDMGVCELTTYVPGVVTPSTEAGVNWTVYYDDRFVRAVDEWQQSIHVHVNGPLVASFATDGNRDNNNQADGAIFCTHTANWYSYWGMEFDRVVEVSHVIIFFRYAESVSKKIWTNVLFFLMSGLYFMNMCFCKF